MIGVAYSPTVFEAGVAHFPTVCEAGLARLPIRSEALKTPTFVDNFALRAQDHTEIPYLGVTEPVRYPTISAGLWDRGNGLPLHNGEGV